MSREHVGHKEIAAFGNSKVNLPVEDADEYKAQAYRLRDKLDAYVEEHPDFTLKRIMLSGSLAKGTSLRWLNDIDLACYISGADAPHQTQALLDYLAERLRKAFPNFKPEQVKPQTYSVTVSFIGSGLDVDVVPILYEGDKQWYGNLVSQDDGHLLKTSIPLHLEFIKKRKKERGKDFAQVIRLAKTWAKNMKEERKGFRFKSFMIELIMTHLSDTGTDFSDYPEALQSFFTYIARTGLRDRITFSDCYKPTTVGKSSDRIQIFDPVNSENNVACLYDLTQAEAIVEAALDAGDAIDAALTATTKGNTVIYWQKVFGSVFQG